MTTLNLLAWREKKSWHLIKQDALLFCVFVGVVALLLEAGLFMAHVYQVHIELINRQLMQETQSLNKQYQIAMTQYQQLLSVEAMVARQQQQQQQWLNDWQKTYQLAMLTPARLWWRTLEWGNSGWILNGFALSTTDLDRYLKKLQGQQFDAELVNWQASALADNQNNFTLNIHARVKANP